MIARARFVTSMAGLAAVCALPLRLRPQEIDPATTAATPELRVLLGHGTVTPIDAVTFAFNGQPYRGSYRMLADGSVVNLVGLEDYLGSVVAKEMPPSWPAAALQAQAVCARTYVLARSNPNAEYDLVPSEADQVYLGMRVESATSRQAVLDTTGMVLRYGGAFATVAYSSCCGGHTESSADAWNGRPLPYLSGVVCPYCAGSPHYRWRTDLSFEQATQRLRSAGIEADGITGVAVGAIDASGRARTMRVLAQPERVISATLFRRAVGYRDIPSLLIVKIDPTQAATGVSIEGGGLGHGVGMCQWGARGMADRGSDARSILAWYFPGTTIDHD